MEENNLCMEKIVVLLLVLSNIWVLVFLMFGDRMCGGRCKKQDSEKEEDPLPDIMGKSLFIMPEKRNEGEAVDEKDVTFADKILQKEPKKSARVPDEKLDEVFEDMRITDVPVQYGKEDEYDELQPQAGGTSFEDIDTAVGTLKKAKASTEEIRRAGKVFTEMEGNELFEKLTQSSEISRRIRMVLTICLNGGEHTGGSSEQKTTHRPKSSSMPENFEGGDEFYNLYLARNEEYKTKIHELVGAYLGSPKPLTPKPRSEEKPPRRTRSVPQVPDNIEGFDIRDFI